MTDMRLFKWRYKGEVLAYRKMRVRQKDDKSVEKFRLKLIERAGKLGGVFIHYEVESGTWLMKVDHF